MAESVINHPITPESLVPVLNPLSQDQSILRPSLLPGLLESLARNLSHRTLDFSVFEIGNVHLKRENRYEEPLCFAIMLSGRANAHHFSMADRQVDFYDLKGIVENLFVTLGFEDVEYKESTLSILHPGRQAKIYVSGAHVGVLGELHPHFLRKVGVEQRTYYAEYDMQELLKLKRRELKMKPLAQYPASERDWTVTLKKSISFDEIMNQVRRAGPELLDRVELQYIFEHEKLGADCHNVTLNFVYRDRDKTVSKEEVDRVHAQLVQSVDNSLKKG